MPFPEYLPLRLLVRNALPAIMRCASDLGAPELLDGGPVPVSPCGQMSVRRLSEVREPQTADQRALAVTCFGLSLLDERTFDLLLLRFGAYADHAFLLDFKLPERNLEWPAFLLSSPLRHLFSRHGAERRGGMESLLYRQRSLLTVVSRHILLGGAVGGILVRYDAGASEASEALPSLPQPPRT